MLRYTLFGILSSFISISTFTVLVYKGTFPALIGQVVPVSNEEGATGNLSVVTGTDWNNIFIAGGISILIGTILSAGLIVTLAPIFENWKNIKIRNKKNKEFSGYNQPIDSQSINNQIGRGN